MPTDRPRVLYVDLFNSPQGADDVDGQLKAYVKVATVRPFDYRWLTQKLGIRQTNRMLFDTAMEFRPDIIHIGKGESVVGSAIRAIKERIGLCVLHFNGDFRWQLQPWMVDIGRYADYTMVNHKEQKVLDAYHAAGVRNMQGIVDAGADPEVMRPMGLPQTQDVVFLGSNNYVYVKYAGAKTRKELIEETVRRSFDIHVYGTDWEYLEGTASLHLHSFTTGLGFAEACSQAKVSLGVNVVNSAYLYASWQRSIKCMMCGCFHLTHYVPGLETVFANGIHLVWFRSVGEAMDLLRYYLDQDEEREAIARAGRAEVLARHTWDLRIADTLTKWREGRPWEPAAYTNS